MTTPKAILCDFDGVVLDTEWPIYETWRDLYAQEGQELTLETYVQCIGSDFDTWSPQTHLENLTGKSFDWDHINAYRQTKLEADIATSPAMPGIPELFSWLNENSIPLAVVSSSSHNWVDRWLEKLNLTQFVTDTICRGDAPQIKPAPDLFIEALRRLEIPAEHCLVIEDSKNGMIAAQAAHCPTAIIPNRITQVLDFSPATHQFKSATELLEALR